MNIILTHKSPDGDAVASLLGAYLVFPHSLPIMPEGAPYPKEIYSQFGDALPLYSEKEIPWKKVKSAILVDCSSLGRVGKIGEEVRRRGLPLIIIDHHLETPGELNIKNCFVEPFGSTTTILVGMMKEKGIIPTPFQATLLALGIYSDTGSLTYPSTSEEDLKAVAFLLSCGANIPQIAPLLHPLLSDEEKKLLEEFSGGLEVKDIKGVRVGIGGVKKDKMEFNLAPIALKLLERENIEVLFLMLEVDGKTYLIGRSKGEIYDVSKVLSRLGGGGHKNAGAGVVPCSLNEAKERLTFLLPQGIQWEIEAQDIMTTPVKVVHTNTLVKDALEIMRSFGFGGLPVVDRGKVVGVITRKEAEKLAKYGMGDKELGAFAYRDPIFVSPKASLSQVIRHMNEGGIGRILVMERGKLVGIITRQDVIGALYGQRIKEKRGEQIIEEIDYGLREKLLKIGELAASLGMRTYLVGGVVRDIILGKGVNDLDILVVGKAIELAEKISQEMKGELISHHRFGTATVRLPDGLEIDFASARREFYPRAAVLPAVEPGSLKEDLFRRDFTINALALSLHPREFGFLVDYFGGMEDLRKKSIKVLHSLSFWEDPTRLLRAIRLEAKLCFKMDEWTEKLARDAVIGGALAPLSGERFREELKLTIEENPAYCLVRMEDIGVLKAIHQKAKLDKQMLRRLLKQKIGSNSVEEWILYLYPVLGSLNEEEIKRVTYRLRMTSQQREKFLALVGVDEIIANLSSPRLKRSQIYRLLRDLPAEIIFWMRAKGDRVVKRRISLFWEKLRFVKVSLTGEDLMDLGIPEGPMVGQILSKLLEARLDGKVRDDDEEKSLALKLKEVKYGGEA